MTDAKFPALGFDPARGDVVTVREVAVQLDTTGTYAGEAHGVLTNIQHKRDVWTGNAADAFADKLGELPGFLDAAHDSMSGAARALTKWADRLAAHQAKAIELEKQAQKLIDAAHRADAAAQEATATANTPVAYSTDDPAAAQAAQRQAQARAACRRCSTSRGHGVAACRGCPTEGSGPARSLGGRRPDLCGGT